MINWGSVQAEKHRHIVTCLVQETCFSNNFIVNVQEWYLPAKTKYLKLGTLIANQITVDSPNNSFSVANVRFSDCQKGVKEISTSEFSEVSSNEIN